MKILVTGGAGYIGSFMVKRLLDDGHSVVVVDSLARGHREKIDKRADFFQGDLLDKGFIKKLFKSNKFDTVMHFASCIAVGESMKDPGLYFQNNVLSSLYLLDSMHEHDVKYFIFSSTGTVYGTPKELPIPETHDTNPENPYAESKLMVERILHWYFQIHGIGSAVLRYFNAAGASLDGTLGESHDPETHLIPNAIKAALEKTEFHLFGDDYKTRDGSAIRDYIHVLDLIEAHILTLQKLQEKNGEYIFNVGTGRGHTNKEVVQKVKEISGVDFPVIIKDRREGDVAETVADTQKIQKELNFTPKHSDLNTIINSAWKYHSRQKS